MDYDCFSGVTWLFREKTHHRTGIHTRRWHFPGYLYSSTNPWLHCVSGSDGSSVPRQRGEQSKWKLLILKPSHVLGPALTHKGTRLIILSQLLALSSPAALEWRLLQGSYGAPGQTCTLNMNNECAAKWISHILVSGEKEGLL